MFEDELNRKLVGMWHPSKWGYMNELWPHPNERDVEDKMTKEGLKELKITTYTNKVHLSFRRLNYRNSIVKCSLFWTISYWIASWKFSKNACEWGQSMPKELGLVCESSLLEVRSTWTCRKGTLGPSSVEFEFWMFGMGHYKWYQNHTSPSKMWFGDELRRMLVGIWHSSKWGAHKLTRTTSKGERS